MNLKHQRRFYLMILAITISITSIFSGTCLTDISGQAFAKGTTSELTASTKIKPAQADKMALELTNKIWMWDWVAFFVPYMSDKGVKKLLPASKHSEWAGAVDMTTGKKLKFTKKKIQAARKKYASQTLTCKDVDRHALLIMQSNGDWDCISFMLPYMTHKGIRTVVRCYNKKHGGKQKRATDYY